MPAEHYQNVVIGSGEAGKFIGWTLARLGQRTVIVERSMRGGMPDTAPGHGIFAHPTIAEGLTVLFGSKPATPMPNLNA
jgi:thioredoxin reductase